MAKPDQEKPIPADEEAPSRPETPAAENGDEDDSAAAAKSKSANSHLRRLMRTNYLEYASYVIRERAIPEINDGLKPVQRRILWSLRRMDDGKFHKVANVVGHTMQYHPHGDASIYEALVNLANKDYFIEKQGNFGNIHTGDEASAARYIECRLTPLAKETLFNADITDFIDSYDGRNREPIFLPAKIPVTLMLGSEGIAPGMTTRILPHNFKELLTAQIAILKEEPYELFPDFQQGGIMDASEYDNGRGRVTVRARIDMDGRKLIIREIPPTTTTESLIASIEKAANKNKIKIASINDFTTDNVEIEITPARGYNPQQALQALYAYTDCSVNISSNLLVIRDERPVSISVNDALEYLTERLVEYLRRELQIELGKLNERFHEKTLAQIFIENRIYKRIENCATYEKVLKEVHTGLKPFRDQLKRDVTDEDVEKLLAIPIRRISLFDMTKNKRELDDIVKAIDETEKHLRRVKAYTIRYLESLIERYADKYPRLTEIETFERVDKRKVALNNIKVGWDRKNSYIGSNIRSDNTITCNEFDRLVCLEKQGAYKVIAIPEKEYVGKLCYFGKWNAKTMFSIVYRDADRGVYYTKRCAIDKFIIGREYAMLPPGCRVELITTADQPVYECEFEPEKRRRDTSVTVDFSQVPKRSAGAKGFKLTDRKIAKFRFVGQSAAVAEGAEEALTDENGEAENADAPAEETPKEQAATVPEKKGKKEQAEKREEENPDTLSLEADDGVKKKQARKASSRQPTTKPAAATGPKPTSGDGAADDDGAWGIVQPELGF